MKKAIKRALLLVVIITPSSFAATDQIFEVKAVSTNSVFYQNGKAENSRGGDEVVYQVNIPEKTVVRTAVYNKGIKGGILGGVQSDNTVYKIFRDEPQGFVGGQRLIRAFGQTGAIDGYELIVIGEDFVTTSRSTGDYFVLYHYKRTDPHGEEFRANKLKEKSVIQRLGEWFSGQK